MQSFRRRAHAVSTWVRLFKVNLYQCQMSAKSKANRTCNCHNLRRTVIVYPNAIVLE